MKLSVFCGVLSLCRVSLRFYLRPDVRDRNCAARRSFVFVLVRNILEISPMSQSYHRLHCPHVGGVGDKGSVRGAGMPSVSCHWAQPFSNRPCLCPASPLPFRAPKPQMERFLFPPHLFAKLPKAHRSKALIAAESNFCLLARS